jgi:hypothetical protein
MFLKTKEEITQWLDEYKIKNYTINDDLTVNVDGSVYYYEIKINDLLLMIDVEELLKVL